MYQKDIEINHPKKFQRQVNDVASNVLSPLGYYLSRHPVDNVMTRPVINVTDWINMQDWRK